MSYDVAVWDGDAPANDEHAVRVNEELWARYEEGAEEPSPRILAFLRELTARYPDLEDLPENEIEDSPWSVSPTDDAVGVYSYLCLVYSKIEEALPFIVQTAKRHGLVCFDPQQETLL